MNQRPPRDLQIPFDRVTYRDGQLLASRDLQDDVRADQRLRSLHTRYLHDTWGIALGFTVTASVGSSSVHVGPGYAIDASAQELLLAEDIDGPVAGNAAQPGGQLALLRVIASGKAPHLDENILGDFFGRLVASGDAESQAEDHPSITVIQFAQGSTLRLGNLAHQSRVVNNKIHILLKLYVKSGG